MSVPRDHPYVGRPDYQFWRKDPALSDIALFDPISPPSFQIAKTDRVVTAGSCFAQHVARFLAGAGFNFLVTEKPHPLLNEELARSLHYGLFSARYGNIYSARQLRQLLERAYGLFDPIDISWQRPDGRYVDPFRPQILPGGYVNEREVAIDRAGHLNAVRDAIDKMDVFVFTLGLTEIWQSKHDGSVFPLAPGVVAGSYDKASYSFHNLDLGEVVQDLQWSLDFIRARNPEVKCIITVSPVPLNATALDRHVAVSTSYSKSVLRIAAEQVTAVNKLCDYYPSYEIITSPYTRASYFEADCREINAQGVNHVMGLFLKHYADSNGYEPSRSGIPPTSPSAEVQKKTDIEAALDLLCDEEMIDNS